MQAPFVDIPTAITSKGYVSVIGVVVDLLGVFQTNGSSVCVTFTLKDGGFKNGHTWDGLKIKYFNDDRKSLPPAQVGDVVALRSIRIRPFNGKAMGVASQAEVIQWVVFRQGQSPLSGPFPFEPSAAEKRHASMFFSQISGTSSFRAAPSDQTNNSPAIQSPVSTQKSYNRRRFSLIKDVEGPMYVDLVAQVVKTFFNDSEKAVIYVTDYTTNETLFDYGQDDDHGRDGDPHNYLGTGKRKWKGPAGRMSLQVTLWEPHASYARENLKLNDFVLLTNVKIRKSRVSEGIEASLHGDRMYPNKVCVRTVDAESDDRARDLLRRKRDYWKAHGGKQNIQEEIEKNTGSKKPKKNNNNNNNDQQQQNKKETKKEEGQKPLTLTSRIRPNQNIQSANPSIPTRSLAAILSNESHQNTSPDGVEYRLPFQNLCYRPLVRVVDFFPHSLEDFAVPEDAEYAALSSSESDEGPDLNDNDRFYRWEWRFILLIEDGTPSPLGQPKEQMKLFVSGADAVHLLGIDAKNLRRNKPTLAILREKLFYLWGNLEEEKNKASAEGNINPQSLKTVSSIPFTCCIKEYGVKCTHDPDKAAIEAGLGCSQEGCFGWERRFAMFQTVIHG